MADAWGAIIQKHSEPDDPWTKVIQQNGAASKDPTTNSANQALAGTGLSVSPPNPVAGSTAKRPDLALSPPPSTTPPAIPPRGFLGSLGDQINPIPAIKDYVTKGPSFVQGLNSARSPESLPFPAGQGPGSDILGQAAQPAQTASQQIASGDYLGAGGTLAGGYGVPAATAALAPTVARVAPSMAKGAVAGASQALQDYKPTMATHYRMGALGAALGELTGVPHGWGYGIVAGELVPPAFNAVKGAIKGAAKGYGEASSPVIPPRTPGWQQQGIQPSDITPPSFESIKPPERTIPPSVREAASPVATPTPTAEPPSKYTRLGITIDPTLPDVPTELGTQLQQSIDTVKSGKPIERPLIDDSIQRQKRELSETKAAENRAPSVEAAAQAIKSNVPKETYQTWQDDQFISQLHQNGYKGPKPSQLTLDSLKEKLGLEIGTTGIKPVQSQPSAPRVVPERMTGTGTSTGQPIAKAIPDRIPMAGDAQTQGKVDKGRAMRDSPAAKQIHDLISAGGNDVYGNGTGATGEPLPQVLPTLRAKVPNLTDAQFERVLAKLADQKKVFLHESNSQVDPRSITIDGKRYSGVSLRNPDE